MTRPGLAGSTEIPSEPRLPEDSIAIERRRPRRAEAFLGRRKTTSPAKFDKHVRRQLSDWQEFRIRTALGMEFRQSSRVLLVKPAWMPRWLYDRLLRSIVTEPRDVESR